MISDIIETIYGFMSSLKCYTIIAPDDLGVRIRLGRVLGDLEPGWHWQVPVIEEIRTITASRQTLITNEQSITAKDGTDWQASVAMDYEIVSASCAMVDTYDIEETMPSVISGFLAQYIAGSDMSIEDRRGMATHIQTSLLTESESMGVDILDVRILDLSQHIVLRHVGIK